MAKITSYAELEKQINKVCSKAVQNTCNKLLEVLQQYIMSEYYDVLIRRNTTEPCSFTGQL